MGVVYEATHARLAGRYAIKVLTPEPTEGPEGLAQFAREARITSLLQHPNVVQVIDHNTAPDGTEYLVMEYLAGESLSQRLAREGRLSARHRRRHRRPDRRRTVGRPRHGIVHRDLKPDNVVLVPVEGRQTELVKILDFGVSRRASGSLEASGMVCGTPQYMAPEQVEGRVLDIDASTNQFALAVIAQELLTGRNPFAGDSVAAIFARVSSAPPMTVGFGEDVDAVLARALAKSGRQRFRSVADFSEAFRAAALARGRAEPARGDRPGHRRPGGQSRTKADVAATQLDHGSGRGSDRHRHVPRGRKQPQNRHSQPTGRTNRRRRQNLLRRQSLAVVQQIVEPEVTVLTATAQPSRRTDGDGPSDARTRRQPARIRPTSHATTSRPRSALPVDEDATMPLTET